MFEDIVVGPGLVLGLTTWVSGQRVLLAVNRSTGSELWRRVFRAEEVVDSSVLADGESVAVGLVARSPVAVPKPEPGASDQIGQFLLLSATSGNLVWGTLDSDATLLVDEIDGDRIWTRTSQRQSIRILDARSREIRLMFESRALDSAPTRWTWIAPEG
ncbi:MAG: hypothetical protein HYV07_20375 [Deltaproteobacteria bacterium]|nr:hypothetical protein [Deltaproteobacteria bacterium]